MTNIRVEGRHILINGALGNYTLHLGSAVVHRQPGGAVCIVPGHSPQRRQPFLPFVDDDPRTAEVVSKLLLLGRNTEIKDPAILEQLRAGRSSGVAARRAPDRKSSLVPTISAGMVCYPPSLIIQSLAQPRVFRS
jgi:hypothetical protein